MRQRLWMGVVVAFALSACSGTMQHKLTVWVDSPMAAAINGVDEAEFAAYHTGLISLAAHKTLNPKILRLNVVGRHINELVDAMPVGAVTPPQLTTLVNEMAGLLTEIATVGNAPKIVVAVERVRSVLTSLTGLVGGAA